MALFADAEAALATLTLRRRCYAIEDTPLLLRYYAACHYAAAASCRAFAISATSLLAFIAIFRSFLHDYLPVVFIGQF